MSEIKMTHSEIEMAHGDCEDHQDNQLNFVAKHKNLMDSFPAKEIYIDREQENKDVVRFQKTGDMSILERVYLQRIPTIRTWAAKNYYPGLTNSVEDLFEELSMVFVKAAEYYKINRGSFNTCLYTFFDNRIKNIKSGMHAKKRISEHYDGPRSGMVLSLDYSYGDDSEGSMTLKDIIPCSSSTDRSYQFDDIIETLSNGDHVVKNVLYRIGDGESITSLLRQAKIKRGTINIAPKNATKLKNRKNKHLVKRLIMERYDYEHDFKVVDYSLTGRRLSYKLEFKKTKESENISDALKRIKKNKAFLIKEIKHS